MRIEFIETAYKYCTAVNGDTLGFALHNTELDILLEDIFCSKDEDGCVDETREPILKVGKKYKVTIEEVE